MTTTEETTTPAPDTSAAATPAQSPSTPEKTFSQAQLDAIVKERLDRDRKSRGDVEAAQAAEQSARAERDKALADLAEAQRQVATLTTEKATMQQAAITAARDTALQASLTAAGVGDAELASLALLKDGTFIKDGVPDAEAIKAAVEALKKSKPILFGKGATQPDGLTSVRTHVSPNAVADSDKEALDAMKRRLYGG